MKFIKRADILKISKEHIGHIVHEHSSQRCEFQSLSKFVGMDSLYSIDNQNARQAKSRGFNLAIKSVYLGETLYISFIYFLLYILYIIRYLIKLNQRRIQYITYTPPKTINSFKYVGMFTYLNI